MGKLSAFKVIHLQVLNCHLSSKFTQTHQSFVVLQTKHDETVPDVDRHHGGGSPEHVDDLLLGQAEDTGDA